MNMDKKTLLRAIAQEQETYLTGLTDERLREEFSDWFQVEPEPWDARETLIGMLLEDYMMYREDESMEELSDPFRHLLEAI